MSETETIKDAKELAKYYYRMGIPCYMEGPPGVGKSQAWYQISQELGIGFIDLRLAQMDPVDLRGLPKHKGDTTTWSRPDFWPTVEKDGEKGIILFDELGDCGKAMQSAAYQIILDGKAGPHEIPKGWYRCAAGNSQKHRAGAQAMSTALANRFGWIEIEANKDCFHEHGIKNGFHHFVLGFIKLRPALLHDMEKGTSKAFPSPRSWERVSSVCDAPEELRFRLVRGLVGGAAAAEFEGFLKTLDLPDLEDILKDPKNCPIPKQPSSRYALTAMLSHAATKKNFDKIMVYCSRKDMGRDFEICGVLDATKRDPELCNTKAFVDFANRNQDLRL